MKIINLLFLLALAECAAGAGFDQEHSSWAEVLERHVRDGLVDYAGLKAAPEPLERYLDQLAAVAQPEFRGWPREEQIAFLVNLYNAATLKLIIDHYPISGIKKIGGLFGSPWRERVVPLFGRRIHLDELEHGILRPQYNEPRVHFALVCAAHGCPALRSEPYVGARLAAQLDDQARRFLNTTAKNRVDLENKIVYLSPIFKWYAADFEHAGSVLEFTRPYWPEEKQRSMATEQFAVRYTDYDWALNQQTP